MNNKRLGKSVLSIVLAAAMAFSPILHTYASEAPVDIPAAEETVVSESVPQEAAPAEEAAPMPEQTAEEPAVVSAVPEYTESVEEIPTDMPSEPVEEAAPAEEEPAAPAEEITQPEADPAAPAEESIQPETDPDAEDEAEIEDLSEETEEPEAEEEEEDEEEEEAATRTEYNYEDDIIKVTAYLANPEDLSDRAELYATPVIPTTPGYNYNAYFEALNAGSDFVYDDTNTYLYDFAFWENGIEVQPAGEITVVAQFKNALLANYIHAGSAEDVRLIHLPLAGAAATAFPNTQAAVNISKYDIARVLVDGSQFSVDWNAQSVTFRTNSLSVWALVNTAVNEAEEEPAEETELIV